MKHGGSADTETVSAILAALESQFHLNIITLIPPVLVIVLAVMKKPALPTLLISGIVAAAIAIFMQGETLPSIANIMENGYVSETGFADIDSLLSRGGLFSMNYTPGLHYSCYSYTGQPDYCQPVHVHRSAGKNVCIRI